MYTITNSEEEVSEVRKGEITAKGLSEIYINFEKKVCGCRVVGVGVRIGKHVSAGIDDERRRIGIE